MSLPPIFNRLRLPMICSPLFIISNPDLVIAQCKAGVVGSFPALNARPGPVLEDWLKRIEDELGAYDEAHPNAPSAPFAVNQIVHKSNDRLDHDVEMCVKYKVPVVITSLGARPELNEAIHSYGGIVLHDVIDQRFAHKAIEKGADGLILVASGAGGHAGTISPFAFVQETREWFDGPIALSGSIANGGAILAAQAMGADFAYIGSAFIATREANASDVHKQANRRRRGEGHRLHEPFHGRARQLPASLDRRVGSRPRQSADVRPQQDELWLRGLFEVQGVEGHLGFGAGHWRGQSGRGRGRLRRAARPRICAGQRAYRPR